MMCIFWCVISVVWNCFAVLTHIVCSSKLFILIVVYYSFVRISILLLDIWVVSSLGYYEYRLQWTFFYVSFGDLSSHFHWSYIYMLNHWAPVCLVLIDKAKQFSVMVVPVYIPARASNCSVFGSCLVTPFPHVLPFPSWLMMLEIFLYAYQPFWYFLVKFLTSF